MLLNQRDQERVSCRYSLALNVQSQLASAFSKVLQSQTHSNWGLRVMEPICRDVRWIAINVQRYEPLIATETSSSSSMDEHAPTGMEKAADVLMGLFRVCAADTSV